MNRRIVFAWLVGMAALPTPAWSQTGAGYTIRKFTMDGGGTTLEGGTYRLEGTVGQHDAQELNGGNYILHGGFWAAGMSLDTPPGAPVADPSGIDKCRFISWSNSVIGTTAMRVVLVSLHQVNPPYAGGPSIPFSSFEGQVRWVGPPTQYFESTPNGIPFMAARLQCTPHYQDWSTVGLLHVTGSAIVPSSIYWVEIVASACQGVEFATQCLPGGSLVSATLQIKTTRWGDLQTPFNPPSPSIQPDLGDISALVNKFRNTLDAPIKARALLVGVDAAGTIDIAPEFSFIHIAGCVDAFRGRPYQHTIQACP